MIARPLAFDSYPRDADHVAELERHHQLTVARMLTREAREAIRTELNRLEPAGPDTSNRINSDLDILSEADSLESTP